MNVELNNQEAEDYFIWRKSIDIAIKKLEEDIKKLKKKLKN